MNPNACSRPWINLFWAARSLQSLNIHKGSASVRSQQKRRTYSMSPRPPSLCARDRPVSALKLKVMLAEPAQSSWKQPRPGMSKPSNKSSSSPAKLVESSPRLDRCHHGVSSLGRPREQLLGASRTGPLRSEGASERTMPFFPHPANLSRVCLADMRVHHSEDAEGARTSATSLKANDGL